MNVVPPNVCVSLNSNRYGRPSYGLRADVGADRVLAESWRQAYVSLRNLRLVYACSTVGFRQNRLVYGANTAGNC